MSRGVVVVAVAVAVVVVVAVIVVALNQANQSGHLKLAGKK